MEEQKRHIGFETMRILSMVMIILMHGIGHGGLGSAVCEVVSLHYPVPVIRHGVKDEFGRSGAAKKVLAAYGLTPEDLARTVRHAVEKKAGPKV